MVEKFDCSDAELDDNINPTAAYDLTPPDKREEGPSSRTASDPPGFN